jgi:hypothetical protein
MLKNMNKNSIKNLMMLIVNISLTGALMTFVFLKSRTFDEYDSHNSSIKEKQKMSDSISKVKELEKQKKSDTMPYAILFATLVSVGLILYVYKDESTR